MRAGLANVGVMSTVMPGERIREEIGTDAYYGGLVVEAMLRGKPVVAWINTNDLRFVPQAMARDLGGAHGALVAVPTRHLLLVHPIRDSSAMLAMGGRMRVDHIVFWVEDPLRSLEFYGRNLGLEGVRVEEFALEARARPFAA